MACVLFPKGLGWGLGDRVGGWETAAKVEGRSPGSRDTESPRRKPGSSELSCHRNGLGVSPEGGGTQEQ